MRIQDVAIGCAVSLVVGVLFWPRGAGSVVGDDLADAFRRGADYLQQAVDWCLGLSQSPPDTAGAAISAGIRLDDALRLYLAEQGTKQMSKQDLWNLVMATMRLRLTANSLAALRPPGTPSAARPGQNGRGGDPALGALAQLTTDLTGFYERVAAEVGPPHHDKPAALAVPALPGLDGPDGQGDSGTMPTHQRVHALWVREHLYHLGSHAPSIIEPAERLARLRRYPWWQR